MFLFLKLKVSSSRVANLTPDLFSQSNAEKSSIEPIPPSLCLGNAATPYPMVPVLLLHLAAPQSPTIVLSTSATKMCFLGRLKKSPAYDIKSARALSFPPTCFNHQDHSGK